MLDTVTAVAVNIMAVFYCTCLHLTDETETHPEWSRLAHRKPHAGSLVELALGFLGDVLELASQYSAPLVIIVGFQSNQKECH